MRAAYPEKHTKRVRRSSAADLFCMRQVSGAGPDGPRRPARFTLPRMNALARLRPGSSCGLPASAARQRKGTKRIMTPAAQGPPAQRRPSPAPCGESFCPMHRCRRRNPAYHESAVHGRAGPAGGGERKTADSGRKAVRIVFCLRLGGKIPAPHSPAMACTAFRGLAWRRE